MDVSWSEERYPQKSPTVMRFSLSCRRFEMNRRGIIKANVLWLFLAILLGVAVWMIVLLPNAVSASDEPSTVQEIGDGG